jgi:hypothetical protein
MLPHFSLPTIDTHTHTDTHTDTDTDRDTDTDTHTHTNYRPNSTGKAAAVMDSFACELGA